jgi:hypothetical protein
LIKIDCTLNRGVKLSDIDDKLIAKNVDDMLLKAGILSLCDENDEYVQLIPTEFGHMYAFLVLYETVYYTINNARQLTDKLCRDGYYTKSGTITQKGFNVAIKQMLCRGFDNKICMKAIEECRKVLLIQKNDPNRLSDSIELFHVDKMSWDEILDFIRNLYITKGGNSVLNQAYAIRKGLA